MLDVGGAPAHAVSLEFLALGENVISVNVDVDGSICRSLLHQIFLHRLVHKLGGGRSLACVLRGCGAELRKLYLNAKLNVATKADISAISTHFKKLSLFEIRGDHVLTMLAHVCRTLGADLRLIFIGLYCSALGSGIGNIITVPDLVEHCVKYHHVYVEPLKRALADVLPALGSRICVLVIVEK